MIEVFRTNVLNRKDADRILKKLHATFPGYTANFDLQDCDHILRIDSGYCSICADTIIQLLKNFGFHAYVLPDHVENSLPTMEKTQR